MTGFAQYVVKEKMYFKNIINNVYKNQRAPITPFSGYKNTVLIISINECIVVGVLVRNIKISTIRLVINDIVKNGTANL